MGQGEGERRREGGGEGGGVRGARESLAKYSGSNIQVCDSSSWRREESIKNTVR